MANPDEIEMLDERGFPRELKAKINEIIGKVNIRTDYKFDTDSLNPIIKVKDTPPEGDKPARRTVTFPRSGAGAGSSSNPYIMGTNSTPHSDWEPADDVWDIKEPPEVDGSKTDGVIFPYSPRVAIDTGNAVSKTVTLDGGGTTTITTTPAYIFTRRMTFDNLGNLIHIGPENDDLSIETVSLVTLT